MLLVAVVAMALGLTLGFHSWMVRRKEHARDLSYELVWEMGLDETERSNLIRLGASKTELSRVEALLKWHKELHEKYSHIYRHPWVPAWPDPPEPTPGLNTKRIIVK